MDIYSNLKHIQQEIIKNIPEDNVALQIELSSKGEISIGFKVYMGPFITPRKGTIKLEDFDNTYIIKIVSTVIKKKIKMCMENYKN